MIRYATLYLVTLFVIVPLDLLFLGVVARGFFTSQVGNMLGEIKLALRSCSICSTSPAS